MQDNSHPVSIAVLRGHYSYGALVSMQVCRLYQILSECLLLVGYKVMNPAFDLLTVLSCGVQGQRKLIRTCFSF